MAEEKRRIPRKDRRGMNPNTVALLALEDASIGI